MSIVSLVGAGPGDLSLISLKALDRIKRADVIVYDNLIAKSILNEAKLEAKLIYAGKEANNHYLKQNEINDLLIKLSKEYEFVLRLKGGDPYVFGRGGEEVEALKRENIKYEVISGITSPIAALASAGIPISHRNYASSFHIITGQESKNETNKLDYSILAKLDGSLVFMMSLNNAKTIVDKLIKFGKPKNTLLSIISRGTYMDEERYDFTLESLKEKLEKDEDFTKRIKKPALMVVGAVAGLDFRIDKEQKVKTKNILITGTRQLAKKLSKELEKVGANAINLSLIETIREKEESFKYYIDNINKYTYVIFTSPNGVDCFFDYIIEKDIDIRKLAGLKFAVIGMGTAATLKERGIIADFIPSKFTGECLATELIPNLTGDDKLVLFRAKEAGQEIIEVFKKFYIDYVDVPLYKTIVDFRRKDEFNRILEDIDYICITSGSGAKAIVEMIEDKSSLKDKLISIGPSTSGICKKYGLDIYYIAKEYSVEGIAKLVAKL